MNIGRAIGTRLQDMLDEMNAEIDAEADYIISLSPRDAARHMQRMRERWERKFGDAGRMLARQWITAVNEASKTNFETRISSVLGVPAAAVLDDDNVRRAAEAAEAEAVILIKKLPATTFDNVEYGVMANYRGEKLPGDLSLIDYIHAQGDISRRRARLIARDQTSKVHAAVTRERAESCGITEFVWKTAGDERVTGMPGGLWPKGNRVHGNHYDRNGKTYAYTDEFTDKLPDGLPGYPINCRCVAAPVIDFSKLVTNVPRMEEAV
jgi:uncharacterized protein with gpF-like domain